MWIVLWIYKDCGIRSNRLSSLIPKRMRFSCSQASEPCNHTQSTMLVCWVVIWEDMVLLCEGLRGVLFPAAAQVFLGLWHRVDCGYVRLVPSVYLDTPLFIPPFPFPNPKALELTPNFYRKGVFESTGVRRGREEWSKVEVNFNTRFFETKMKRHISDLVIGSGKAG